MIKNMKRKLSLISISLACIGCFFLVFLRGREVGGFIEWVLLVIVGMMAYEDLLTMKINGYLIRLLILFGMVTLPLSPLEIALDRLGSSVVIMIILMVINRITRDSFGLGDVIVLTCIALVGGRQFFMVIAMLAMFFAGIVSMGYLLINRRGQKKTMPFIPFVFLALGVMVCQTVVR